MDSCVFYRQIELLGNKWAKISILVGVSLTDCVMGHNPVFSPSCYKMANWCGREKLLTKTSITLAGFCLLLFIDLFTQSSAFISLERRKWIDLHLTSFAVTNMPLLGVTFNFQPFCIAFLHFHFICTSRFCNFTFYILFSLF